MILIIGGMAQGKLAYVKHTYQNKNLKIFEAVLPSLTEENTSDTLVVNHLNDWIRKNCTKEECRQKLQACVEQYPNLIFISDEIGSGIVPMEKQERQWRDMVGNLQVELAEYADEVVRVLCGIGQKIK